MTNKKKDKAEGSDEARREYERLKKLTRHVVSVPREVIEQREGEYRRERKAKS